MAKTRTESWRVDRITTVWTGPRRSNEQLAPAPKIKPALPTTIRTESLRQRAIATAMPIMGWSAKSFMTDLGAPQRQDNTRVAQILFALSSNMMRSAGVVRLLILIGLT